MSLKYIYYLRRIRQLGLKQTIQRTVHRAKKEIYKIKWKQKALKLEANHSWKQIAKKHCLKPDFFNFFEKISKKNFLPKEFLENSKFSNSTILGGKIDINKRIDWHSDFKCPSFKEPWNRNGKLTFYQNIKIGTGESCSFKEFSPDIKSPWEISRFQEFTNNKKLFWEKTIDWIDKNPYLLGANWLCPMDVAIRAINLIYGFYKFKDKKLSKKLICSLYDHAKYLETNWETSDKPNNHYLSDLIGYLYLCFFFDDIKKFENAKKNTIKKILEQFDKQIQNDGTSYEGSTAYHRLVTEIFNHFYLLCKKNNISLPESFFTKLKRGQEFLFNCYDHSGNFIQIGDNDGGKIVKGIIFNTNKIENLKQYKKHYTNFGLTIIKNKKWHITFRHPTYTKIQPTGHFHQDNLSITASFNGIPILVDPGSYVYTANKKWRNYMRSYENHNTVYTNKTNFEKIDLFQLPKTERKDNAKIFKSKNKVTIENFNQNDSTIMKRKLMLEKNSLTIQDKIIGMSDQKTNCYWNLIFGKNLILRKQENVWKIFYKDKNILYLKSNLKFKIKAGFYSPEYGIIRKCSKLSALDKSNTGPYIIKLYSTKA